MLNVDLPGLGKVIQGKEGKDRTTMLPEVLVPVPLDMVKEAGEAEPYSALGGWDAA